MPLPPIPLQSWLSHTADQWRKRQQTQLDQLRDQASLWDLEAQRAIHGIGDTFSGLGTAVQEALPDLPPPLPMPTPQLELPQSVQDVGASVGGAFSDLGTGIQSGVQGAREAIQSVAPPAPDWSQQAQAAVDSISGAAGGGLDALTDPATYGRAAGIAPLPPGLEGIRPGLRAATQNAAQAVDTLATNPEAVAAAARTVNRLTPTGMIGSLAGQIQDQTTPRQLGREVVQGLPALGALGTLAPTPGAIAGNVLGSVAEQGALGLGLPEGVAGGAGFLADVLTPDPGTAARVASRAPSVLEGLGDLAQSAPRFGVDTLTGGLDTAGAALDDAVLGIRRGQRGLRTPRLSPEQAAQRAADGAAEQRVFDAIQRLWRQGPEGEALADDLRFLAVGKGEEGEAAARSLLARKGLGELLPPGVIPEAAVKQPPTAHGGREGVVLDVDRQLHRDLGTYPERAMDNPAVRTRVDPQTGELVDVKRNVFGNYDEVADTRRPLDYVYRAVSGDELARIRERGLIQSDGRMNLVDGEGTVAKALEPPVYYLPEEGPGTVLKIRVHPEDGWRVDPADGYVKTTQPVPADRIVAQSEFDGRMPTGRPPGTAESAGLLPSPTTGDGLLGAATRATDPFLARGALTGGERAFDIGAGTAGGVLGAATADDDATWQERAGRGVLGASLGALGGANARQLARRLGAGALDGVADDVLGAVPRSARGNAADSAADAVNLRAQRAAAAARNAEIAGVAPPGGVLGPAERDALRRATGAGREAPPEVQRRLDAAARMAGPPAVPDAEKPPGWSDWTRSIAYGARLSNVGGILADAMGGPVEGAWKLARDALGQRPTTTWAELAGVKAGMTEMLPEWWRTVRQALPAEADVGAGKSVLEALQEGVKEGAVAPGASEVGRSLVERLRASGAGTGQQRVATAVEFPSRLRRAFNQANFRVAYNQELYRRAAVDATKRQGLAPASREWWDAVGAFVDEAPPAARKAATDAADLLLFRNDPGTLGRALSSVASHPVANVFVPFFRTGYNVGQRSMERTPGLGAAGIAADVVRGKGSLRERVGAVPRLKERVTDQAMGSMLFGTAATLAEQGLITGDGPDDPDLQKELRANGWRPNSVLIGGQYHDYSRLGAMAFPLALAGAYGDSMRFRKAGEGRADILDEAAGNFGRWGVDQTVLRQAADLYEAIGDPMEKGARVAASSLAPYLGLAGVTSQVASAMDPAQRDPAGAAAAGYPGGRFGAELANRVPGLRQTLPARRDDAGQPTRNDAFGLGALNPLRSSGGTPARGQRPVRRYLGSRSPEEDRRIAAAIKHVEDFDAGRTRVPPKREAVRLHDRFVNQENPDYVEARTLERERKRDERLAREERQARSSGAR